MWNGPDCSSLLRAKTGYIKTDHLGIHNRFFQSVKNGGILGFLENDGIDHAVDEIFLLGVAGSFGNGSTAIDGLSGG